MRTLTQYIPNAETVKYRFRVQMAIALLRENACGKKLCVAYSGGKDSTVCLDLAVRAVGPDRLAVGFFDCGTQLPDTYAMLQRVKDYYGIEVETYRTQPSLVEALKAGNYWGYRGGDDALEVDFEELLVFDPARRFSGRHPDANAHVLGLRADESTGRAMRARTYGVEHRMKSGELRLCPLSFWGDADIWAYILTRDIPYNAAYDKMLEWDVPAEMMRVSCFFGASAAGIGRYAYLKMIAPEMWNTYAAIFPKIRQYA